MDRSYQEDHHQDPRGIFQACQEEEEEEEAWKKFTLVILSWTTDAQLSSFSVKSRTSRLGQTSWGDKFWVIFGIFCQTINTQLSTVSPMSMFFFIQPLFLQKVGLYIRIPNICLGLGFEFAI